MDLTTDRVGRPTPATVASTAHGPAAHIDPATASAAATERKPRILVVDDVPDNRDILTRRLIRRGFDVVEATGGHDTLDKLGLPFDGGGAIRPDGSATPLPPFDVVLLDIMMPDLGGNEVLARLRETLSDSELPVIMVSAKSQSDDVVESLKLGANDYVTKPVDFAVALARINTQLARKRTADIDRARQREIEARAATLRDAAQQSSETLRRTTESLTEELDKRRHSEEQLRHMAYHDALTGLMNRAGFRERLAGILADPVRMATDPALLFIDLDRFKAVNDVNGHDAGDRLLCEVADRLRAVLGPDAPLARLGGDEFAALVAKGASGTEQARHIVAGLGEPFFFDGQHFQIGASCGVARATDCEGRIETLLKAADLAMYRAKNTGRGRFVVFEPQMLQEQRDRSALEVDLRAAIAKDGLEIFYQPLIAAATHKTTSFEALLRWPHPTRGMISPEVFISLAEETGLIVNLGAWVLHRACAEAATWRSDVRIAVNLSPLQFRDPALLSTIRAALETSGLDANRLEVEITESALLEAREHNLEILRAIREMGVRVSMDDFGTGYSSMSYLQNFEFDKIKIDRRFVQGLEDGQNSAAIIKAIVELGINIGIDTTAEGVETAEQLACVMSQGCTEVQGYFFSRPLTADLARAFLADRAETTWAPMAGTLGGEAACGGHSKMVPTSRCLRRGLP